MGSMCVYKQRFCYKYFLEREYSYQSVTYSGVSCDLYGKPIMHLAGKDEALINNKRIVTLIEFNMAQLSVQHWSNVASWVHRSMRGINYCVSSLYGKGT